MLSLNEMNAQILTQGGRDAVILTASEYDNYKYLHTFFNEKGLESMPYTHSDSQGNTHILDTEFVIGLLYIARGRELEKIANIVRQIDFADGDLHHFLSYCADAYVQVNFSEQS